MTTALQVDYDKLEAGLDTDALVYERLFGWLRVQAPKHDYDGPLPEQGEVLASPEMAASIERGEYHWPPKGIIPFTFFVTGWAGRGLSTHIDEAWRVVEHLRKSKGAHWEISCGDVGWNASVVWEGEGGLASTYRAETAPLAICRAALKAIDATKDRA